MNDVAPAVAGFVAGVISGLLLRDAATILATGRHNEVMRLALSWISARRTAVGIGIVTLALIANLFVGFLLIATRASIEEADARDDARLACQIRYNALEGRALTSRQAAVLASGDAERRLWEQILAEVRAGTLSQEKLDEPIVGYLAQLDQVERTRQDNPYPSPDMCLGAGALQ